jgi:hypothetical protein
MHDYGDELTRAVAHFWHTRQAQSGRQGGRKGRKDTGERAAVTGGAQMDGFVKLVRSMLIEAGLDQSDVFGRRRAELPGWFRAEKQRDLAVVLQGRLIAAVEFKSQVGPSFGNNFNNRTEEALGSATDLWAAYRQGAFRPSARPWLGYIMLLEETTGSVRAVAVAEPHFAVFPEFKSSSYTRRYQILLTKLVRERLYDGAAFLMTNAQDGPDGAYKEPLPELSFARFAESLLAKAIAAVRTKV